MSFINGLMLAGLALASVPIIIHLLNRRRFKIIDWAPMKYLKLTLKTNRRRMRIEQLILLAVRTLVVIILVLAVARPVLSQTGFGGWLGGRSRTARILIIDDSLSMGYQTEGRRAFDEAKAAAAELVQSIGAQDSITALTASAADAPLVRDVSLQEPGPVLALIGDLALTDAAANWAGVLEAVDGYLSAAAFPVKEVTIITDLRRSGWSGEVTEIADRWAGQSVAVKIVDVGSRQTQNIALSAFGQEEMIALPNSPIRLRAQIRNDQTSAVTGAQAVLSIGQESRPVILPDLAPGATTDVPLTLTLQEPGQYPLRLQLAGDALPQDDLRWLNVTVRPRLDIALVDGELGARPFESETDFLAVAFTVGNEPWHVHRASDSEWGRVYQAPADVLVLANVASVPPEQVASLERLVESGAGLMIFMGEQVDPQLYNQRLFRDGAGLLPARIDRVVDEPVTGLVVEKLEQSPLALLASVAPEALARVQAKRYMGVSIPGQPEDVRVLARWNNPEAHPAIVEKRFGRGRVILWTMTADRQWGDWPIDPTYVLAARSSAISIARGERHENTVSAGEPIQLWLEAGAVAMDAKIALPDDPSPEAVRIEKDGEAPPHAQVLRHGRTARAGVYTLSWKDATGQEQSHVFAVNPARAESDLEPISEDQLAAVMGNLRPTIVRYTAGMSSLIQQGREIWRSLAVCVLALMAVETVLAVWVGRER